MLTLELHWGLKQATKDPGCVCPFEARMRALFWVTASSSDVSVSALVGCAISLPTSTAAKYFFWLWSLRVCTPLINKATANTKMDRLRFTIEKTVSGW
jgi:hypothetical protein